MAKHRRRAGIWSPSLILRQKAISQGFLGGRPVWQLVGAVIFGRRLLRRLMGNEPEIVATERLEPGQFVHITALPPDGRAGRRRR